MKKLPSWRTDEWMPGLRRVEAGGGGVGVAIKGHHEWPLWGQNALYSVCTSTHILVVMSSGPAGWHHGGNLAAQYSTSFCVISYTCMRIYDYLKIKSLIK